MKHPTNMDQLLPALPGFFHLHAPDTEFYKESKAMARKEIEKLFSGSEAKAQNFGPFGDLIFPYHKMGAVDSLNLFDLDELIIFSFYWLNRSRYKRAADIGANIGLHSILMDKCGFEVRSYEPDPQHFEVLQRNLKLNNCSKTTPYNCAVSIKSGEMEFVRVLGNTTGSHLAGAKPNPLGQLDRFLVEIKPIAPIIEWADFLKIDAEGHEKDILLATSAKDWADTDALVEVGNEDNARHIFDYFNEMKINLFAQKTNWQLVESFEQMPTSYRDGSLFITSKYQVPW